MNEIGIFKFFRFFFGGLNIETLKSGLAIEYFFVHMHGTRDHYAWELCPSIIGGQCSHVKWRQVQGPRLLTLLADRIRVQLHHLVKRSRA